MTKISFTLLVSMLVAAGCAPSVKQQVNFNPAEPLRVAVVPFQRLDKDGRPLHDEGRLFVDNIPIVSTKLEQTPSQIVRRLTFFELEKTNLDVVAPVLIDMDLPHSGFVLPDGKLDIEKVVKTAPSELCGKFLNCDAVLYGTVYAWDRKYYGLQSSNRVGIEYKLVSARDNSILFSSRAEGVENRGLTGGPTGFGALVIEPVRGLDSDLIVEAAESAVQKGLAALEPGGRRGSVREAPPAVYSAATDATSHVVSAGNPITVVIFGSPGHVASFSLGGTAENVPMIERSPGHYYGEYRPATGEKMDSEEVTVRLTDRFGRATDHLIKGQKVRAAGPRS